MPKRKKMNRIERRQEIRKIISANGQAAVNELSASLNVTEATIRSDLEGLEQEGFLTRFHGGASIRQAGPEEAASPLSYADCVEYNPKRAEVGVTAANLITSGEGVFLGPGTTNYYIALALRKRTELNVNIVTNNFLVAGALRGCRSKRLHFIGGRTEPDGLFTVPEDIGMSLADIYLDKMYFSIDGIDLTAGYTLSDPSVHNIITTVSARSKQTIMAADTVKFNRRSFMKIGDLTFAPVVVSNPDIPESFRKFYQDNGIILYT